MSTRCTKITLMYAGGMVDIRSNYVYYVDRSANKVSRVTNTLEFRHTTTEAEFDIIISPTPLEITVAEFEESSKGKKSVNRLRVTGTEHVDKPLTAKEKAIRKATVDRVLKRASSVFNVEEEFLSSQYKDKINDIMDRIGSEVFYREFSNLVNENRVKNFSNIIAFLNNSESLDSKAIKIANNFAKNNNKSEIIAKMKIVPGEPVTYNLEVDWSKQDSISDHAYVRWLERVEGVLNNDLFNKALVASLVSPFVKTGSTSRAAELYDDFFDKCSALGLDRGKGAEIRSSITEHLSNPSLKFSSRRSTTSSSIIDRFNALVEVGEKIYEFTLFPYEIRTLPGGKQSVKVKVLSVLDRNYSKTTGDVLKTEKIILPDGEIPDLIAKNVTHYTKNAEKFVAQVLR